MDARILIDSIVRQTTILIAQISTSAGIRAPLAHVADQVFLDLAREIERQGVRQKIAADMFGVALRTYQKKVQRLTGCAAERNRTLWEAVVSFIVENDRATRAAIEERFRREDDKDVAAVLKDLVESGLVYATGSGGATVYGMTSALDRKALSQQDQVSTTTDFVWLAVFRHGPLDAAELSSFVPYSPEFIQEALDLLVEDGRVDRVEACDEDTAVDDTVSDHKPVRYRTSRFTIPVGSVAGWEAAVFDHYQAVALAISAKINAGAPRSNADDTVGGATLAFDISADHPHHAEVMSLLHTVRTQINELWSRVEAHNQAHAISTDNLQRITFYFGQHGSEISMPSDLEDSQP